MISRDPRYLLAAQLQGNRAIELSYRRNVLFVIIDQLRADCLFGQLADHVNLPNMRKLMDDAVSFSRHYSVANPCGPSRASILTGQYAMNHRSVRNGTPLPHDLPNIATEVRKAGYLPLLFGYTDTSMDPRQFDAADPVLSYYEQVMPGFEEIVEMRFETSWPWRADLLAKGYDVPPYPDIYRPSGDRPDDPAIYSAEDSDTAFLTDQLINQLRARPKGWFAHLTYIRPHPPLVAPEPYNRMYDPAGLPRPKPASPGQEHKFDGPCRQKSNPVTMVQGFPDLGTDDATVAMLRSIYLGLATEVDHHLGRIIDFLRETGQYDDTLIVVTADHGEMLGDYQQWGKSTYYEAAYHTPLIIRDPDLPDQFGQIIDEPTEAVDVAPTILDLLGRDAPDTMDGSSLRPFLTDGLAHGWRKYTWSELDFGDPATPTLWQQQLDLDADLTGLAILRGRDHTLVHFNGGLPQILFDHGAEGEARNIAGDTEAQPALTGMMREMLDHRMTHANGRFSKTMVTSAGVVRVGKSAS